MLSLSLLPHLIPVIVSAFLITAINFGHLNFKLVPIKTIQRIGAIAGAGFGFTYFTSMYKLLSVYGAYLFDVHMFLMISIFICAIALNLFTRRITPNIVQIIGLILFAGASYFILA